MAVSLEGNPYEAARRAAKVRALTELIDAMAPLFPADPFSTRLYLSLQAQSPQWWAHAAKLAGINPPSEQTISEVLAIYRDRPALRVAVMLNAAAEGLVPA